MGTYIGHCDSCTITLEAEQIVLSLLLKYDQEKIQQILEHATYELGSMDIPTIVAHLKTRTKNYRP
jgi:hypothetical protein